MADSLIDRTLGGCHITRELARGGMSTIYLAEQTSLGRSVALKVMSQNLLGDPTFMARFSREVATTARLQHPHIIPVYDFGQQDGVPYIVMAYVPGGSLEDLLASGPLSLDEAARIIRQVAAALDYAHTQGIIHRDVKPANILLDAERNAVLSDFGIAKLLAATQSITKDDLVGTPSYLAPELISDSATASPAVDVYGLGVTLYRMLTGVLPFPARTAVQMMWAHVNEPAPPVTTQRPDLPSGVDQVLQKALAKTPDARYASAAALADDLEAVSLGIAPAIAEAAPPPPLVAASPAAVRGLEAAVRRVIDQVVKINLAEGGSGSGVYVPGDDILTCLHVVDGSCGVYVRFRTGEQIEADVLATSPAQDLALLHLRHTPATLDASTLNHLVFERVETAPGAPLAAIGHPFGLNWAVTGGHFNGLRMPGEEALARLGITLKTPLVQVDVAINPGNSGGPLIDAAAHLVGLADATINPAMADNIGFAIDGQTAYIFWQRQPANLSPLVAYNCGHHHAADLQYCPLTGRPLKPCTPVPLPAPNSRRYSCGHFHGPGLEFCPLTGKPVHVVGALPDATASDAPTAVDERVTCTNCGKTFPASETACPYCGKQRRRK